MKKIILLIAGFALLAMKPNAQTITDIDGNVYNTITIGKQVWTKENLKVTHYLNGDPIPEVADSAQWYNLTSGAYCDYNNDANNASVYGRLYNWHAVHDTRNIAPLGWHVPTYEDWDSLQVFLGYDLIAGGKLKEIGTSHWMFPNTGASDEYDFTALPGGQRADSIYSGTFSEITQQGYWWSSSEMDTIYPWGVNISYNSEGMTNWAASTRKSGFSIRLIKDINVGENDIIRNKPLNIFPNPARDNIKISTPEKSEIAILNLQGQIIKRINAAESTTTLDISAFARGMYFIKVATENEIITKKFIKE